MYYSFCVSKYTANHFQKPTRPDFSYWPNHLTLKMFVMSLCPPESPKYFWPFIFQEDIVDAKLGISTCSLVPLAALGLFPYTRWGRCGEEGRWVPFARAWGGQVTIQSYRLPPRHLLWVPFALTPASSGSPQRRATRGNLRLMAFWIFFFLLSLRLLA